MQLECWKPGKQKSAVERDKEEAREKKKDPRLHWTSLKIPELAAPAIAMRTPASLGRPRQSRMYRMAYCSMKSMSSQQTLYHMFPPCRRKAGGNRPGRHSLADHRRQLPGPRSCKVQKLPVSSREYLHRTGYKNKDQRQDRWKNNYPVRKPQPPTAQVRAARIEFMHCVVGYAPSTLLNESTYQGPGVVTCSVKQLEATILPARMADFGELQQYFATWLAAMPQVNFPFLQNNNMPTTQAAVVCS